MKLKARIKTVIEVEASDFDRFVQEIYGSPYVFEAEEEAQRDCIYDFSIKKESTHHEWDIAKMEKVRSGEVSGIRAYTVLETLLEDGHIVEGEYLISTY